MDEAIWTFRCDFGHHWQVAESVSHEEPPSGACPEGGHSPVTARRERWADRVQFLLHPMARINDSVRDTVTDEAQYRLTVHGRDGSTLTTPTSVTLDDAAVIMRELAKSTTAEALRKAQRMGLLVTNEMTP